MNTRIHILGGAILAGLAQTATVYIFAALFRLRVSGISEFIGGLFTNDMAAAIRNGRIVLAVMALVWGFVYQAVRASLPRRPYTRGITFGLFAWLITTGVVLPILALMRTTGPSPGFFAFGFGGVSAVIVSVAAHIVYGIVLSLYVEADGRQTIPQAGPA